MPFQDIQETGRPVKIKDEGITLVSNVSSIDFTGSGVTGSALANDVSESIPGGGGGGSGLSSFTSPDSTLTIGGTLTDPTAVINLTNANTWTGKQTFNTTAPTFGTMTLGSVLFAGTAGLLSQDNTNFFWDSTNTRLGIGTNTPSTTLHSVRSSNGATAAQLMLSNSNTSNSSGAAIQFNISSNLTTEVASIRVVRTNSGLSGASYMGFNVFDNLGNGSIEKMRISEAGLVGIGTTAPTHSLTLGSTSTGIALYNTSDQTTNYERAVFNWSSNIFSISTSKGGTGTLRELDLASNSRILKILDTGTSNTSAFNFTSSASSQPSGSRFVDITPTFTSSGGNQIALRVSPTINQSGSTGYIAFLINPTETAIGTGPNRLISAQVGGTDKFVVDNAGLISSPFNITSSPHLTFGDGTDASDYGFAFAGGRGMVGYTTNDANANEALVLNAGAGKGLDFYVNGTNNTFLTGTLALSILSTGAATFSSTIAASNFSGSHSGTSSGTNTGDQTLTSLLPSQTGNNGKYLTTNGTAASWGTISGGGDMLASTYDPSGILEQLVGLTAIQTLYNKTLDTPTLLNPDIGDATGSSLVLSSSVNPFAFSTSNGHFGIFNIATLSLDQTYTLPNSSGTFALLGSVQAFSNKDLTSGTNTFPTFNQNTTGSAAKLTTARTIGGVSFDGTANITVSTATAGFTVSGGNLALGTNSLTMSGSIGVTGTRVTKGWFTDLEVTNSIVGSITGNAATVTTNANLTGVITSSGNATSIASSIALPGSPTTTTQTAFDNSTKIATTAYVDLTSGSVSSGVAPVGIKYQPVMAWKSGLSLGTITTLDIFTVPGTVNGFVATGLYFVVDAVTGATADAVTLGLIESGASKAMTQAGASAATSPFVGMVYGEEPIANSSPYSACLTGNKVQLSITNAQTSTTITGTCYVQGYYY